MTTSVRSRVDSRERCKFSEVGCQNRRKTCCTISFVFKGFDVCNLRTSLGYDQTVKRLAFVTLLLVACSRKKDEQRELETARARAAEAHDQAAKAQEQAIKAQQDLQSALSEEKAAEQDKLDIEQELADAQAQTKELLALATKKVEALKKQRAALPDGPKRRAIDDQITALEKVIQDSQTKPSPAN